MQHSHLITIMYLSYIRNQTGDGSTHYQALKIGTLLIALSRIETPDKRTHRSLFVIKGGVAQVQRRVSAMRTACLWLWADRVDCSQLLMQVDAYGEIQAASVQHPDSQRLAAQCMAAEEIAKVASQALKIWYGVTPAKARKLAASAPLTSIATFRQAA